MTNVEPKRRSFFFEDHFTDLLFLYTLCFHGFKGAEIGECYSAAAKIREDDLESWKEAWSSLGEQVEEIAKRAEARGHRVSARDAYLRAVTYYGNASYALRPSDPHYRALIEKSRVLFQQFAALCDPPIEVVAIPYEGTTLPGYFLRPKADGRKRPTIVIGDNRSEVLYYWVAPPALERGYNALLVDLPGIGLNAFNGITFRADTEVPVKAVIDYLCSRGDVDPTRIAVYGGGEGGGYIMTRAASREHRIAACVVDPLVSDVEAIASLFTRNVLRPSEKSTLASAASELTAFTWGWTSPEALKEMKVDLSSINCPVLVLNEATDYPELLQQTHEAIATVANARVVQHLFTPEDRTGAYRQLDNFGLKHRVMFDWLDEVFGSQGR